MIDRIFFSRNYLDNLDQPTAACVCQSKYKTPKIEWKLIQDEGPFNESSITELENGKPFKELFPWYTEIQSTYSTLNSWKHDWDIFYFANNESCSCSNGRIDSSHATADFKMKYKNHLNLVGWPAHFWDDPYQSYYISPCTDEMKDVECLFSMREHDVLDLFIENDAKDTCIQCYGVGPDLWPISKAELFQRLTRTENDIEDCKPKLGYHKSHNGEIYRCEAGNDLNGIISFTEADGSSDYNCGFVHWNGVNEVLLGHENYNYIYPIFMVGKIFMNLQILLRNLQSIILNQ